jgi:hypothetical protein
MNIIKKRIYNLYKSTIWKIQQGNWYEKKMKFWKLKINTIQRNNNNRFDKMKERILEIELRFEEILHSDISKEK